MEWSQLPPIPSWVATHQWAALLLPRGDSIAEAVVLTATAWLLLAESGRVRGFTRWLSQELLATTTEAALHAAPFPAEDTVRWRELRTVHATEDMREGRLFAGFANACMRLGHFPQAREPAMLRVAVQ